MLNFEYKRKVLPGDMVCIGKAGYMVKKILNQIYHVGTDVSGAFLFLEFEDAAGTFLSWDSSETRGYVVYRDYEDSDGVVLSFSEDILDEADRVANILKCRGLDTSEEMCSFVRKKFPAYDMLVDLESIVSLSGSVRDPDIINFLNRVYDEIGGFKYITMPCNVEGYEYKYRLAAFK